MLDFKNTTLLALALFLPLCAAAAWTHDAYVWQRQPGPEIDTALRASRDYLNGYCLLAAEVSWKNENGKSSPKIVRIPLDYAQLAALKKPVSLALRIGAFKGDYSRDAGAAKTLATLATELLATARAAGLEPAELQIDFDCPESKLAGYREWLAALRDAAAPTPLTFTALPTWMNNESAFTALAREAPGGFILQVHSLEKPTNIDWQFSLCESSRALIWAEQANTLAKESGARFRIALPTYGYTLGFSAKGKFIGLAAETPRDWPEHTQLRSVHSDPFAMQDLAKKLSAEKLSQLDGIIWFRLPVEGDRLAWNADTFAAVIKDTPLVSELRLEVHCSKPGLAEIIVINRGHTTLPLPETVHVKWTLPASTSAWDGIGGYDFWHESTVGDTLVGKRSLAPVDLAPGRSRAIGWIRFDFPDDTAPENFSIHATIP